MSLYALKVKSSRGEIYHMEKLTKQPISFPSYVAAQKEAGKIALQKDVFDVRVVPYPKAKGLAWALLNRTDRLF